MFLCAGAIETPRLLLHNELANASGQVGRNYMAHVATQVWGTATEETPPNKGYPSSLISEDFVRAPAGEYLGGYIIQSLGVMPMTWANLLARGGGLWGEPLMRKIDGYNHAVGLGINGECLAYPDNRLTLSEETDDSGMPKPHITFGYGRNEQAIDRHATKTMTSILEAAGVSDVIAVQRAAHTVGTCRMGRDPVLAVCDPFGRTFDVSNLWICDNSVFPTSLVANPALTIMALSLRTADAYLNALSNSR